VKYEEEHVDVEKWANEVLERRQRERALTIAAASSSTPNSTSSSTSPNTEYSGVNDRLNKLQINGESKSSCSESNAHKNITKN